ncbi:DivIVA domain-containing protein [Mycobacterium sp. URHD0025]|uniref:DivIVA domain-containing protein n=1 Tax=Mycobacterium sp. URHD0025 TaxID=1298864 RepID=UPI0003F83E0F|nr:DivIVA domain-containing protein [Mycobacterium sp. URHD0025]
MARMTGGLTAEDVRSTEFGKRKRGYDKKSVDDFLALVARRLDGRGHLGADDVRNIVFPRPPMFQRGYDEDEVDMLLDAVVATLER